MNILASCFVLLVLLQPPSVNRKANPSSEPPAALPVGDYVFHRIVQGNLAHDLVERGELQAVKQFDVICKLRAVEGSPSASTITWLIEDGSMVKSGQIIAKLDERKAKDQLQKQMMILEQKKAELTKAMEELAMQKEQIQFDTEMASLRVEEAALDAQDAKDEQAKRRADLKNRMANLALTHAKREAASRIKQSEAQLVPFQLALREAEERLKEAHEQYGQCAMTAQIDGIVTYYVPDSRRIGASAAAIEVGESVNEGQKLLQVSDLSKFQVVLKVHESIVSKLRLGMKANVTVAAGTMAGTVSAISPLASAADWMSADVKVYPVRIALESDEMQKGFRPGMTCQVTIRIAEKTNSILIPVQAVREERGRRYCYVKAGSGIERRDLKYGISNNQSMEVLNGLKAGDEVVMNPPRKIEPKDIRKPVIPDPKPEGVLLLRSVRPAEGAARRPFIERYGLTQDDLDYLRSLSHALLAPLRQSTAEARAGSEDQFMTVPVIGATPELGEFHPSLRTGIEGRFLCDHDNAELARVAVIGKAVADKLFPRSNPLGERLRMSGKNATWTIVGVLAEQQGNLERLNEVVLLPYAAELAHRGETVVYRSSGTRGAEVVPYTHILFQPPKGQNAKQTARIIRSRLEMTHAKEDWALSEPEGR